MREKDIPFEQIQQNENLLKVENEENNGPEIENKEDKESSIVSRLKFGWEKIKEKTKESLKKNTKRAVVLSSIAFTMLSASDGRD